MDDNKNLLTYKTFKIIFAHGPGVFKTKESLQGKCEADSMYCCLIN
jgi:hypothetical protein